MAETYLPDEIITEIILRLPVKSLLKFRSVPKSWLSFISSSKFAKTHLKISTTESNVSSRRLRLISAGETSYPKTLFYVRPLFPKPEEKSRVDIVPCDQPRKQKGTRIFGSCNGLLLLVRSHKTRWDRESIVLWNPVTGKSRELPWPEVDSDGAFSLGYDAVNDDYKVIYMLTSAHWEEMKNPKPSVQIYSLRAKYWDDLEWAAGDVIGLSGLGVFLNGFMHWKIKHESHAYSRWAIVALNMMSMAFTVIDPPNCISPSSVKLGASQDHLWLSCVNKNCKHLDVWLLKEYGVKESWSKLARIPYVPVLKDRYRFIPHVLFVAEDEGIILLHDKRLVMYKSSQSHVLGEVHRHFQTCTGIFVESLVSPN